MLVEGVGRDSDEILEVRGVNFFVLASNVESCHAQTLQFTFLDVFIFKEELVDEPYCDVKCLGLKSELMVQFTKPVNKVGAELV